MRKRKFAVGLECKNLLEVVLDKALPLTITNKTDDNSWHVFKSNLLSIHAGRIEITQPVSKADNCAMEAVAGQEIAVTFKKGYNKCLFVSRVISQSQFELPDTTVVSSITLYRPEQIEKIQRRAYDRTEVPSDEPVIVTFWASDDRKKTYQAELLNISAGGVGIRMPESDMPQWQDNQQCDMHFVPLPGQEPIVTQGRFRHNTEVSRDGNVSVGFQFVGLELTEHGRSLLRRIGRIVTVYQKQTQQGQYKR